jgi:hypothetical protein
VLPVRTNNEPAKAKQVLDDASVPQVLTEWYDEFSLPQIWNYGTGVEYDNVKDFNCNNNYNLFADRELVCVGPMNDKNACLTPSVTMTSSDKTGSVFSFSHQKCAVDIKCNAESDQIIGDPSDIMTNPIPRSKSVDLKKVYAYQQMKKMLDYYHSLYDEDHKTFLKSKVENFAVWQDFVTEFTSLVVVESEISRNRRGLQMIHKRLPNLNVQIKKKRSQEKKDQLSQYFSKYQTWKNFQFSIEQSPSFNAEQNAEQKSDAELRFNEITESGKFEEISPEMQLLKIDSPQKQSKIRTILYISVLILAFKLITSRKGRNLIRFK